MPTPQEAGVKGFDVANWQAVYAPAGTLAPVVQRLGVEIGEILAQPDVREKMEGLDLERMPNTRNTPKQFAAFNVNEIAKWNRVVRECNV